MKSNELESLVMKDKLRELLGSNELSLPMNIDKIPLSMTEVQIKTFVLNKQEFPTAFSQYHQAKIEIWSRLTGLTNMYFDLKEKQINLREAEYKIENIKSTSFETERLQLECEKTKFQIVVLQKSAHEKSNELKNFYDVYKKHQHLDKATAEELQQLEVETWNHKLQAKPQLFKDRYNLEEVVKPK